MKTKTSLLLFAVLTSTSCQSGGGNMIESAGSKLGSSLTSFTSGFGRGVDKEQMVDISLSPELTAKGITATTSKTIGFFSSGKGISVYLISDRDFNSQLMAKAINESGQEVGRSLVNLKLDADEAEYVKFKFASELDQQLVSRYTISER